MKRTAARADASSVRSWNEFAVVESLRTHGPQRISELGRTTGLTPAPLGQVMRGLEAKGWVVAGAPTANGPGRPAQTFSLSRPVGWVVGLDVGAHVTRSVVTDLAGDEVARAEVRLSPRADREARHDAVAEVVASTVPGGAVGDVWLTTLAVGGHLRPDGTVVRSVAIPEWDGQHPAEVLGDLLPGRVRVVNDVRAATWAEHAVGAARDYDEILVAHLGRRPTLGLLFGGRPRRGAHGTAGDMSLNPFLPTEEHMAWLEPFSGSDDPLGDAVRAACDGDTEALAGACRYVESVAPSLAFAASVVDPAVFVVGGALSPLADGYLETLRAALAQQVQQPPIVVASVLDQFATALGAALLGVRTVAETLASPTHGVAQFTQAEFTMRDARAA